MEYLRSMTKNELLVVMGALAFVREMYRGAASDVGNSLAAEDLKRKADFCEALGLKLNRPLDIT